MLRKYYFRLLLLKYKRALHRVRKTVMIYGVSNVTALERSSSGGREAL